MWKVAHVSVTGSSHAKTNTPCQDSCEVREFLWEERNYLLVAVSDGAGSAKYAADGSNFVTSNWVELVEEQIREGVTVSREFLTETAETVHQNLSEWVTRREHSLGEYACTLLGGVIWESGAAFFQVGDGAWVIEESGGYRAVTWPFQGHFAGEILFLTSNDRKDAYDSIILDHPITAIAGFTDGLERLCLQFSEKKPTPNFFAPLFTTLEKKSVGEMENLLTDFLNSERVNERTDDDKTLVLASLNVNDHL